MPVDKSRFATLLQEQRQMSGLTMTKAASQTGVDRMQWWRWETGRSIPKTHNIYKIAATLAIDPIYIFASFSPS